MIFCICEKKISEFGLDVHEETNQVKKKDDPTTDIQRKVISTNTAFELSLKTTAFVSVSVETTKQAGSEFDSAACEFENKINIHKLDDFIF